MSGIGPDSGRSSSPWHARLPGQFTLLLLVCALVYWLGVWVKPLDFSEGHRAIPGWTMARANNWWRQEMFGQVYIRKPPGIAWAIGASARLLGESVFSARAVSALCATVMPLIALLYARRWFGPRFALAAGLAQALTPLFWSPGRSAEIEMLMLFGTQLGALGLVDLCITSRGTHTKDHAAPAPSIHEQSVRFLSAACVVLGVSIAALAKGPAAAPVLGGVLIACPIVSRSFRSLMRRHVWTALILAAGGLALLGMKFINANNVPDAVRENVAQQFLWSGKRVWGVLTLPMVALCVTLPASVVVVWALVGRAPPKTRSLHARAIALAWLIAIAIMMLAGVSNHRYTMPAAVLLPPVVAAWYSGDVHRNRLERRNIQVLAMILTLVGVGLSIVSMFPTKDQRSGVELAQSLAESVPTSCTIWADDAIEARPDILWHVQERSRSLGKDVTISWAKASMTSGELPSTGACVLLRTDAGSAERERYAAHLSSPRVSVLLTGSVRQHEYTLIRVLE